MTDKTTVVIGGIEISTEGIHTVTGHFTGPHNYNIPPQIYGTVVRDNVVKSCVDVLVTDGEGRILLGERNILPWRSWWSFGGAMIPGESPDISCSRMLKKDLGLDVTPDRFSFVGFKSSVFGIRREEPETNGCHDFNLFHIVTIGPEEKTKLAAEEYRNMAWWRKGAIVIPAFHPTIVEMVQKAII